MKKLFVLLFTALGLSFTTNPGGEGFEIYLGNQLLTQQFGSKVAEVKHISIPLATASEDLVVKYYHCGRVGKNRTITIRNMQGGLLKQFHYADAERMTGMTVPLKILKGFHEESLNIFYSANELPAGRWLATIGE